VLGRIAVATDKVVYTANSPIVLQALVTNSGALAADFMTELRVEDTRGVLVQGFLPQTIVALGGGVSTTVTNGWNTGAVLAGTYRVHGLLRDASGGLVSDAVSTFEIRHNEADTTKVTLRTTTDRPVYHTTDLVDIQNVVANVTVNTLIEGASLKITIADPAGAVVFAHTGPLGQLVPGSLRDLRLPYTLSGAAVQVYTVKGEVVGGDENVLAHSSARFEVSADLNKSLLGKVEVALSTLEVDTSQICTDTVVNRGFIPVSGLILQHAVVNLDTQTLVGDATETVALAPNGERRHTRTITTHGLVPGNYACLLQASIDGQLKTLAYAPFVLKEPPIRLDATLKPATKGRLLVLLDDPNDCGAHEDDDPDDKRRHTSPSTGGHRDDDRHKCAVRDADPHGPKSAPGLKAQRAFLEALLKEVGFSYTLTERAQDFTRELRSGNYSAYALLAEQAKLAESVQRELREAVFRGEGLLVAGAHDARHHELHGALGLKLIGSIAHASQALLIDSPIKLTGALELLAGDKALRLKRTTAQALARYLTTPSGRSHDEDDAPDCCDLGRRHEALAQGLSVNHREEPDECGGHPDRYLDAATLNAYGKGKGAFVGFDLLAAAAREGANSLSAQTLKALLEAVAPTALPPTAGSVQPLELTVTNRGIATTATATVTLPAGVTVLDAPAGQVSTDTLTFTNTLAAGEEQTFTFWVKLPGTAGPITFNATVTAGNPPTPKATATYTLEVQIPDLAQLKVRLAALSASTPEERRALKRALEELDRAYHNFYPQKAIEHVLTATEALAHLTDPAATALRVELGEWIRYAWAVIQ
jgi:hypothetical protein